MTTAKRLILTGIIFFIVSFIFGGYAPESFYIANGDGFDARLFGVFKALIVYCMNTLAVPLGSTLIGSGIVLKVLGAHKSDA
ncbi:hypothetical protein I6E29_07960 [Arcanobacterium haemolyticum]|nr:hypothetical protein [Arcanobacterium haemolyticum]